MARFLKGETTTTTITNIRFHIIYCRRTRKLHIYVYILPISMENYMNRRRNVSHRQAHQKCRRTVRPCKTVNVYRWLIVCHLRANSFISTQKKTVIFLITVCIFFFVNYQYLFGAELEWYLFSLCTAVALMQALVRFI